MSKKPNAVAGKNLLKEADTFEILSISQMPEVKGGVIVNPGKKCNPTFVDCPVVCLPNNTLTCTL